MEKEILVTRSSMPELEEYIDEIRDIWDTHWLTNMGPKHKALQNELREYLNVNQLDLFTNGHMAIELSLQAMHFPYRSEVITVPFTFASTTHAIVRNGLEPVFCDINPDDFTINVSKIEQLITEKTCAIMPVHVYGNICNIEQIQKIAKQYNLKVIYDAAHAFGVKYKNKGVGVFGDVSCFSFHATKVFNTIEGGAACFRDEKFGRELYRLKNFGIRGPEVVDGIGANAKMNEFCAAMGICNLRHIEDEISKRKLLVNQYRKYLENIEGIQLNPFQKNVQSNYAYFPIVVDEKEFGVDRDIIFAKLEEKHIKARKYFYPLTNSFECFHDKYDAGKTPIALQISRRVLTLPLYSELELGEVDRICEIILNCKM